jgi:hypothetical protein
MREKNEFMTREKKQQTRPAKAAKEPSRAMAAAAGSVPPLRLVSPAALEPCEAALAAVIGLAEAGSHQATKPGTAEPANAAGAVKSSVEDVEKQLAQLLGDFEPEMALKLRALLLSGKGDTEIPVVGFSTALGDGESALRALASDLSESGSLATECLRRGHALACAAGVPLEQPVSAWGAAIARNLDERAWLSFGRQLAKSAPEDWQCLALLDAKTQQVSKLYLKLGENAWWSFQAQIDRPSAAAVYSAGRALERRRSKSTTTRSLHSVAPRLCATEGRALRRAARAIRARVGKTI